MERLRELKIAEEAMEDEQKRRRKGLEPIVLHRVGEVISAIGEAKHVDQLICALHSLAARLFPLNSSALSGQKILYSLPRKLRQKGAKLRNCHVNPFRSYDIESKSYLK